jgi:uncharacterized protein (DUF305 family)
MSSKIRPRALGFVAAAGLALAAGGLAAQQSMPHGAGHASPSATTPATTAYQAANAKMHKDMAINYTGDANKDFVAGMIPHHQGAIDMAKVVLQYGNDPELRKLADEIIAAQSREIAFLRAWQARNP